MTKWELARYLIDAKKCVDSVMYIARNKRALSNIGIQQKIKSIQREFYINCCYVLDDVFNAKGAKKQLTQANEIIESVYYERDKDKAHKDSNYKTQKFSSLTELSEIMKNQIAEVKAVCGDALPPEITLDFVPHDRELFRFVHSVTLVREEEIRRAKHPRYEENMRQKSVFDIVVKNFHDTEDMRDIPPEELNQYGVVMEAGINFYEGIQNRQDSCIKVNVLYGENMWCSISYSEFEKMLQLRAVGFLDEFDIMHFPDKNDLEKIQQIDKIMNA